MRNLPVKGRGTCSGHELHELVGRRQAHGSCKHDAKPRQNLSYAGRAHVKRAANLHAQARQDWKDDQCGGGTTRIHVDAVAVVTPSGKSVLLPAQGIDWVVQERRVRVVSEPLPECVKKLLKLDDAAADALTAVRCHEKHGAQQYAVAKERPHQTVEREERALPTPARVATRSVTSRSACTREEHRGEQPPRVIGCHIVLIRGIVAEAGGIIRAQLAGSEKGTGADDRRIGCLRLRNGPLRKRCAPKDDRAHLSK